MESFTYMSDEAIDATVSALPDRYEMELNRPDMVRLISALRYAYEHAPHESDDCNSAVCDLCWSGQFVSSIAGTLGVEFI